MPSDTFKVASAEDHNMVTVSSQLLSVVLQSQWQLHKSLLTAINDVIEVYAIKNGIAVRTHESSQTIDWGEPR